MGMQVGYKKTDFGNIPKDWHLELLIELSNKIGDGIHTTPNYSENGVCYFINGNNLSNGKIVFSSNTKRVSKEEYLRHKKDLNQSTVLISINGTIGNFAFYSGESVILGKSAAYINLNSRVDRYFFSQIIQSELINRYFENELTGSTIKNLGLESIRNTPIPLPPLPEQQAIAEVLSDTDNLIQALEKQIAKKRLIKQGVMQKLLTPKEGWEVKPFGGIFEICGGFSATREQLSDEGFCYLHYGDIHGSKRTYIDCSYDYTNIPKLKVGLDKISRKSLLINGDVVFVDASEDDEGTSRHVVIRNENNIPFISGLHTIIARSKDESLDLKYKNYCFQSSYIKDQFRFYAVGTKVSGVSKTTIKNINIYIPPTWEQKEIACVLEALDVEIEQLEKKLSKYLLIKQGLMHNLLTGNIRLVKS